MRSEPSAVFEVTGETPQTVRTQQRLTSTACLGRPSRAAALRPTSLCPHGSSAPQRSLLPLRRRSAPFRAMRQRLGGGNGAVMRRADPQLGDQAGPVRLVAPCLRHHYLRGAGSGSRGRRARTSRLHGCGHSAGQCLLADVTDAEAVLEGWPEPDPPNRGRRGLGDSVPGSPRGPLLPWPWKACALCRSRRTPESAGFQDRHELGWQPAHVGQHPRAGQHDIEVRCLPRPKDRVRGQPGLFGEHERADVIHWLQVGGRAAPGRDVRS